MWVPKLLLTPIKIRIFGHKRPNLTQNCFLAIDWHFWPIWFHGQPTNVANTVPRWFFRYVGTKTFASSCKIRNFGPKRPNLVQNMLFCPFWPNIGNFGPFCPMPDKNTMQTRCLCVFSGIWVPKLLLSPVRIRIFCPKRLKGWLAIAKLIPLSLFISLLLMPNEAFDNVKIEK